MDFKLFIITFVSIFLAELGDKTQLATVGFASAGKSPATVFLGAICALILSSLLGVIVGANLQKILPIKTVHIISGVLFIVIGSLLIVRTIRL